MSARYRGWSAPAPRRSKYNAKKAFHPEHGEFDSGREMRRYLDLFAMQKAGLISDLGRKPHFDFLVNGVKIARGYTGDFRYIEEGELVIEDSKGARTRDWPLRRDLMLACHGIKVLLT